MKSIFDVLSDKVLLSDWEEFLVETILLYDVGKSLGYTDAEISKHFQEKLGESFTVEATVKRNILNSVSLKSVEYTEVKEFINTIKWGVSLYIYRGDTAVYKNCPPTSEVEIRYFRDIKNAVESLLREYGERILNERSLKVDLIDMSDDEKRVWVNLLNKNLGIAAGYVNYLLTFKMKNILKHLDQNPFLRLDRLFSEEIYYLINNFADFLERNYSSLKISLEEEKISIIFIYERSDSPNVYLKYGNYLNTCLSISDPADILLDFYQEAECIRKEYEKDIDRVAKILRRKILEKAHGFYVSSARKIEKEVSDGR